jgi:glucose-6-phosphate dehydrogenase assembly protein OpcA
VSAAAPTAAAPPETRRSRPSAAAAVERELQNLWRDESDARKQAEPAPKPLGRSLLHTLIVFAPDAASADRAREVVVDLTRHQASRSIQLIGDETGQADELEASVTLHCVGPVDGHDTICCEQVTFAAHTSAAQRRLPGAVLPLLLTDVPSFLWWTRGNPFRHPVMRGLEPAVDRLIIDSLSFAAPEPDLAAVAAAMGDPAFRPVISDLSWARLAPWRYQTAQIFDPVARRSYLNRIVSARLNYYAGTPTLAWLFGGWLAARLGWQAADSDPRQVRCRGGQVINYAALPAPDPAQAGYFAGVLLTADDGSEFEVARMPGGFIATRIHEGDLHLDRVMPMRDETLTEWLGHELGRLAPTPTYEAALNYLVDASRAGQSFVG